MTCYPFTAIVGMELAKKSLIYHAIDPRIGGTLFLGHRGCAKSTLARAFAEIIPGMNGAAPFVEVPLGATEDRLIGSLNAELLVEQGKWSDRAGLIEQANGGVLYIDEINLLPDHLADLILDSAATGRHRVERDGIAKSLAARYVLVGTMNPEEGDLRPQLSDRFGHGVRIEDHFTAAERVEIVKRRMRFDDDPQKFSEAFAESLLELRSKIVAAHTRLTLTIVSEVHRKAVADKAAELKLEGIRTELAIVRTARAAAAFDGRETVEQSDINEAWKLCLGHRREDTPHQSPPPESPRHFDRFRTSPGLQTSPAPDRARPEPVELSPPSNALNSQLERWWKNGEALRQAGVLRGTQPAEHGAVDWIRSIASSFLYGWEPGRSGMSLRWRAARRRAVIWCFLDASRSTGMNQFLSRARDMLIDISRMGRCARFCLLLLQNGELRWIAWNANTRHFRQSLSKINTACGKSLLVEAFHKLHRARTRKTTNPTDCVVICSDGLASPAHGETPRHTAKRLRRFIQQITAIKTRSVWISPVLHGGFSRWLSEICRWEQCLPDHSGNVVRRANSKSHQVFMSAVPTARAVLHSSWGGIR